MIRSTIWSASRLALVVALGALSACQPQGTTKLPIGSSQAVDQSQKEEQSEAGMLTAAEDAVVRAARHFTGYRLSDGLRLSEEELFTYLAAADAICIGERHDSALDHYGQWRAVNALAERRMMRGFELGLGLEMVKSEAQVPLNEYLSDMIDRDQFVKASKWEQAWGFPIQFYDPLLLEAGDSNVRGIALGTAAGLSQRVARGGLASLHETDQRQVPPLDLSDAEHRRLFESLMGGHPLPKDAVLDHYYQAQVLWDETMAKRSKQWILQHYPLRKMIILAGRAHCHRSAIPARMERDTDLVVVNLISSSTRPHLGSGNSADDLMYQGYEYQIVFE